MLSRSAIPLLAFLVVMLLCVSSIGLVPVGQGSFSAVRGPVSALRARRAAIMLLYWIKAIAFCVSSKPIIPIRKFEQQELFVHPDSGICLSLPQICMLQC
jgi:hypothetical protein